MSADYHMRHKRAFTLPDVSINETLFDELEQYFTALGGDELSSGMCPVLMYCMCKQISFVFNCLQTTQIFIYSVKSL